MEKYIRAIELMNAVPGSDPLGYKMPQESREPTVDETNARWDELFTFIHDNFPRPNTYHEIGEYEAAAYFAQNNQEAMMDIAEVYDLLRNQKEDDVLARLTTLPPEYRDTVFPVAIARYLLAYKNVSIWPRIMTTFDEFHKRYGVMIVESTKVKK